MHVKTKCSIKVQQIKGRMFRLLLYNPTKTKRICRNMRITRLVANHKKKEKLCADALVQGRVRKWHVDANDPCFHTHQPLVLRVPKVCGQDYRRKAIAGNVVFNYLLLTVSRVRTSKRYDPVQRDRNSFSHKDNVITNTRNELRYSSTIHQNYSRPGTVVARVSTTKAKNQNEIIKSIKVQKL